MGLITYKSTWRPTYLHFRHLSKHVKPVVSAKTYLWRPWFTYCGTLELKMSATVKGFVKSLSPVPDMKYRTIWNILRVLVYISWGGLFSTTNFHRQQIYKKNLDEWIISLVELRVSEHNTKTVSTANTNNTEIFTLFTTLFSTVYKTLR